MHSKAAMSLENAGIERELEAHAVWVRALARSLVGDSSLADDVAQETWLVALQSAPRQPGRMRSWLAGFARRLAARQGSRERRAQGVNDAQVAAPHDESHANLEQLELHAILVDELRTLREPLRTTLLERYFEGLSAAEIAARSGVPAPTVRWRLQQGLEELRTRLDRRFGARNNWMSALAFALPVKEAATVGGVGIGGGLLMSTLVKLAFGAAALVAAVLIVRPFLRHDVELPSPPALAQAADTSATTSATEPRSELASGEAPRAGSRGPAGTVPSLATDPPLDPARTRVTARVLDERKLPLADAWIEIGTKPVVRATANREGLVVADWEERSSGALELRIGATDRVSLRTQAAYAPGKTTYLGDVLLLPGATVSGHVLGADGTGLAGLEVFAIEASHLAPLATSGDLSMGPEERSASAQTTSGSDGRFELHGVAPGSTRIWARSRTNRWSSSAILELQAPSSVDGVVVTVSSGADIDRELRGIVVDPDEHRLPGINVSINGRGPEHYDTKTDARGEFRVTVSSIGPYSINLRSSGSSSTRAFAPKVVTGVAPGPEPHTYKLLLSRSMRVELFAGGAPCQGGWVQTKASDKGPFVSLSGSHLEGAGENVLVQRLPDSEFKLRVGANGCALQEVGPFTPENAPSSLRVDLVALALVSGRVLAEGKPVANAHVSLGDIVPEGKEGRVGPFLALVLPSWRHNSSLASSVETDADGRFAFSVDERNEYHLFAEAPGYARADVGPLTLDPHRPTSDLAIELDAGGTLAGRVLVADGRSPAGTIVGINRADGAPRTQRVGPDGEFRFEHLTAGAWELARAHSELSDSPGSMLNGGGMPPLGIPKVIRFTPNCTITVGQVTRQDLDLRDDQPCVLQGSIDVDGQPAAGWSVVLEWRVDSYMLWGERSSTTISSAGQFGVVAEDPGGWIVELTSPASVQPGLQLDVVLDLKPGPNPWSPQLRTTRAEVHARGDHAQMLSCRSQPEGFESAEIRFAIHKDETVTLPVVPVGTWEIVEFVAGSAEPRVLATFTAVAGQTTAVELP